ncbi:DUF3108 domain-containing protein [Cognatilysobacter lacus]|uniref:DUF3108 domain-containing protein n=1 Tax=Cognatilysobacter lacus TaxID=1643323 RepID=A0A5D8ZAK7_9GAMM|nr:DUF3108 domain-containing protein [Lysobacter lacus]TZF91596.1 DUF3108 domain-containing protein [Lysobacter lacus]
MTKTFLRGAVLAASLALAGAPAFAAQPFSAPYLANYMGMKATGRIAIEPAGAGQWRYTLEIRNQLADLVQTTVFDEEGGVLRPLSGTDSNKLLIKKSNKKANYDWSRGVATWSGDVKPDRAGPVKLQRGDLDALLVNVAIARDAIAGKPLRYHMVENGKARDLTYAIAGKEAIMVNGKSQQATKVVSTSGDKKTTLWVVPGVPVPVRIMQVNDGDTIDLRIAQ